MKELLERDKFRELVFERDGGKCVICKAEAKDAHHILERRLWNDLGYYLNNGASLCNKCHILAEQTILSCEEIRKAAGITEVLLPENLYREYEYDKWGNILTKQGRIKGPLFYDESVQRILESANILVEFLGFVKYPRTWHCPWSEGATRDDRILKDMSHFSGKEVVVTEKLDGENTTMYRDGLHARSIDGRSHPSRNFIKQVHGMMWKNDIPDGWRICGENLYAKHTLFYDRLPSWFLAFSIYDDKGWCLKWDDFTEWCDLIGMNYVPVLYRGIYDETAIKKCYTGVSKYGDTQEGYVCRVADKFKSSDFQSNVFKFVRKNHVGTSSHWMYEKMVVNGVADDVT